MLLGHSECIRILANTGKVDWDRSNDRGHTPLYSALSGGHYNTVAIIVKEDLDYIVKSRVSSKVWNFFFI